ncbi:hypothetical protein C2U65_16605 [Acinetobacter baumannii]|uniref:hypothetical protein n=1 Tax=Acinetobacter baumannii TaxID=470 RepID=UPI000DEC6A5F|nr:hypothetical protein [Acinetobacter baumannii]RCI32160.1 hypothetical protein C2U65_16605 [Acinetobacter baumannii]
MITNVWAELDLNELPFIDKEIGPEDFKTQYLCSWDPGHDITHQLKDDQRNIDEAIFQVKTCINNLENSTSRLVRKNAKEVLQVIKQNLNWEKHPELNQKIHLLQSLLYRG